MKKFISIIVTFVIAAGVLGGCAQTQSANNNVGSEANIQAMSEEIQDMVNPADAILRCMVENHLEFNTDDNLFFWKALYYFAGAYAKDYPEAVFDTDTGKLTLPRSIMRELGSVISSEYVDLPAIPSSMSANVVFNVDDDTYTLQTGDIGLAQSSITSFSDNGDGTYDITVELRGTVDDKLIASGNFKITENKYTKDLKEPSYIYSIVSLEYKEGE